jgi:quinol-cytochrome oxidoreductase complex cytochrome b subunit
MVRKSVHTNIKQTASGQTFYFTASTLQHLLLQHLLFSDFTIAIFLFSTMLCFKFVGLHQLTSGKLVTTVLPNNPRL